MTELANLPNCLVVDDEYGARYSVVIALKRGYNVLQAQDIPSAMAIVNEYKGRLSVAVLDLKLSGGSGLDLLSKIKETDPLVECIILTGFETIDSAKTALRRGAREYLTKPFVLTTLQDVVAQACATHRDALEIKQRMGDLKQLLDHLGPIGVEWVRIQKGVIHDLRNILCVVMVSAELAKVGMRRLLDKKPDVPELVGAVDHLDLMVRQITAANQVLTRHADGMRGLMDEPEQGGNLRALTDDLKLLLKGHPEARHVEIFTVYRATSYTVSMPTAETVRLLLNILINAAQASERNAEVEVRILGVFDDIPQALNEPNGFVASRVLAQNTAPLRTNGYLRVIVTDRGAGMSPELLQRIGAPGVTTKGSRGSGAGTGIVAATIERYGGVAIIRSSQGKGTEVELLLPSWVSASTS